MNPNERTILDLLPRFGLKTFDTIHQESGLTVSEVGTALKSLEAQQKATRVMIWHIAWYRLNHDYAKGLGEL
jgi:hypothetical protein